ncbi:unnamed protein product (macronuclear) [Paramecium tetraurelia]|uniref:Uncharacterized protein n=1 Tax=Paramecium tetraurelia TaxID=5888 RepID=A0BV33_PARTE|nr:uncharacterized protein GSPATT00005646001 [Paramecium tetraurelia]CAK62400.1 unnamed protein product [Paramecium tetraurelia]|eukprot:XP_001429798.1 hypothetical protein (macronuclear) [Paramecium tetraurelia strain d4-2]
MNIKELTSFIKDYDLMFTQKLVKYLVIIGISAMKSKTQDISIETIKLIASSCKQQKLRKEMATLKEKVINIQQSITPRIGNFTFTEDKQLRISKSPLIQSQYSPIQKKKEQASNKCKKNVSIQDQDLNFLSLNLKNKSNQLSTKVEQQIKQTQSQKVSQNSYKSSKTVNMDQIANNFLNSPLIKNPLSVRSQTQQNELQYFFQNTWKQF